MFLSTFFNGLTLAALLFIMAIGLNLSFGLLRVVNLSHGAFYLFGGYIGLSVLKSTGHWWLGVLCGALVAGGIAAIEEIFFLRRVRGKSTLETLITLSMAIIISDLIVVIWGGNPKMIAIPKALKGFVSLFTVNVPIYNLFLLTFACVIGLGLWLLINKTKMGMIIRAGVDNFEMVSALGINIRLVFTLVFSLAGFMAGMAGVIGGTFLMVAPGEDWRILTYTLLIIIIGGMGSFGGTIIGSIIIGLIFSFGSVYVPQFSLFLMFAPVALTLVIRPKGLFGRTL
ncbi:branched-chain amino acid ABC transporter permease [Desulfosporosinus fructosivorans]|uniref:Branched-chain amino acid ABC transporter permease n=1 Tax=Desulfosporosinus fructosivorans TaxID=2018669 RepID=A0A4Z0RAF5_9FIRM|nr:branched-chain amino acid ABC transporter permease [Desulfosporosinus fructosivorans]TGE39750.1 branched-chain amino acid ABC transporter permease [Desulfosporosinus fructosivorans]